MSLLLKVELMLRVSFVIDERDDETHVTPWMTLFPLALCSRCKFRCQVRGPEKEMTIKFVTIDLRLYFFQVVKVNWLCKSKI